MSFMFAPPRSDLARADIYAEGDLRYPALAARPNLLTSLFHEDWWLEAASGGNWAEATVRESGRLVARLPYCAKRTFGLTGLSMPPLTRTLGPQFVLDCDGALPQDYRRLAAELAAQLPRHDYFNQICDPRLTHALPFYALGFDSTLTFTLRIPAGQTPDALRRAQRKQLRYDITRAARHFTIDPAISMEAFCAHHNKWLKANHKIWWSQSYEQRADAAKLRLFEACQARGCIAILGARDGQSALRAAIALVWGNGVMYYWLSSRDPDPAAAGAVKLLMSRAIEMASSSGLAFDVDGFPRASAVSALTGFGGDVTNRITISKFSRTAHLARTIGSHLKLGI